MPKAPKQTPASSRSNHVGGASRYKEPYLLALGRQKLQALAKGEGVRANMKSQEIIQELLTLRRVKREESQATSHESRTATARRAVTAASEQGPNQDREEDTETITNRHIRALRRQITKLNDNLTTQQQGLSEMRANFTYAQKRLDQRSKEVQGMSLWNLSVEKRIVSQMRQDVHLYDGTAFLKKRHQEEWKDFVWDEDKRRSHARGVLSDNEGEGEEEEEGE